MANYKVGEKTKNKIINVAKELFYRNGIENTTYAQISKKAKVNISTIVYHCNSIQNLGYIIYYEILEKRHDVIFKKIDEYLQGNTLDSSTLSLLEYRINTESYISYPKYARFVGEILRIEPWDIKNLDRTQIGLSERYGYEFNGYESFMHKLLFLPFAATVVNAAKKSGIPLDTKQICDYHTKVRLLSMNVPVSEINAALETVETIAPKITLIIDERFNFS